MEIRSKLKYKVSKQEIKSLKEKILEIKGFNTQLALFILDQINKIEPTKINIVKSKIELIDDENYGLFFVSLISQKDNIDIELSLFRNEIEMFVADKVFSIYDSQTIKISNIQETLNNLKEWFVNNIFRETTSYKEHVKSDYFFYVKLNKIHKLKNINLLNHLFRKGVKKEEKYNSWID